MTHQETLQTLKSRNKWIKRLKDEWDAVSNNKPTPSRYTQFPASLIHWQCRRHPEHRWQQRLKDRIRSHTLHRCPTCICDEQRRRNAFVALLSPYWHPTLNTSLSVQHVTRWSHQLAWWHCPEHPTTPYQASIMSMATALSRKPKTQICAPLCRVQRRHNRHIKHTRPIRDIAPHLIAEWDALKNAPHTLDEFTLCSPVLAWWRCVRGHRWKASITNRVGLNRTRGSNCPYCAHRLPGPHRRKNGRGKITLASLNPALRPHWHQENNYPLQFDRITIGMDAHLWWHCSANPDHAFTMTVGTLRKGRPLQCPHCKEDARPTPTLEKLAPHLIPELLPEQPQYEKFIHDYSTNARHAAWWQCPQYPHHQYQMSLKSRVRHGMNCPHCSQLAADPSLSTRSLQYTHPDLVREWDREANRGFSPDTTLSSSPHQFSWRCTKDPHHTWQDVLFFRIVHERGCPHCAATNTTDTPARTSLSAQPSHQQPAA